MPNPATKAMIAALVNGEPYVPHETTVVYGATSLKVLPNVESEIVDSYELECGGFSHSAVAIGELVFKHLFGRQNLDGVIPRIHSAMADGREFCDDFKGWTITAIPNRNGSFVMKASRKS